MEQEIDFKFSPEQQDELRKTLADAIKAFEDIHDVLLKMAKAFLEAIRKAFEFLVRRWTKLQLIEWRLPYLGAEFVSQKIPAWLAYDIGLRWFHKVFALK